MNNKHIISLTIAILLLSLSSINCMTIASTFNHKSIIRNDKTRKTINEVALYGYVVAAIPISVGIFILFTNNVEYHNNSEDAQSYLITAGAVIIALPFVLADMLVAKLVHWIIYGDDYKIGF